MYVYKVKLGYLHKYNGVIAVLIYNYLWIHKLWSKIATPLIGGFSAKSLVDPGSIIGGSSVKSVADVGSSLADPVSNHWRMQGQSLADPGSIIGGSRINHWWIQSQSLVDPGSMYGGFNTKLSENFICTVSEWMEADVGHPCAILHPLSSLKTYTKTGENVSSQWFSLLITKDLQPPILRRIRQKRERDGTSSAQCTCQETKSRLSWNFVTYGYVSLRENSANERWHLVSPLLV